VTYLPWLVGGPLLGGLADRLPRRTVMVCCQLVSAVLVALMAVPGIPLIALAALLFVVILAESPFLSARASLLVDVLPDDRYVLASASTSSPSRPPR
jgi:Major Facilitator Superfamily.